MLLQEEYEGHHFVDEDLSEVNGCARRFIECTFERCIWTGANLSGSLFQNCNFEYCDLSLVRIDNTRLQDVRFFDSKIQGVNFTTINTLVIILAFHRCRVNDCMFSDLALSKTPFIDSELHCCDFTNADLRRSDFSGTNLMDSLFNATRLNKADLQYAQAYSIHPLNNRIQGARVAMPEAASFLTALELILE